MNLVITETTKKNGHKPTICLNMIVKNESKVIVSTLNNLAKYIDFDYWVISDTGSTDQTQQIIEDYFLEKGIPGELVTHEWRDFGHNRTKALEAAYDKTDYLLIFDADDQLHGDFKLPFLNTNGGKHIDRYMLKIGKGFEYVRPLLINNRKRWQFKGVLHEYLSELEPVCGDATVEGDYHIESGRTGNRSQNPTKYYDDAIILQNAYHKEMALPDKGMSGRYAFYCARSYHDAGEKYRDNAIEWYKKVLDIPNHWYQEKYYAALEIGILYKEKKEMDLAVQYLLKTMEYDMDRIEGLIIAVEYFYQTGQYILVNALYHRFKSYNKKPQQKLFINMHLYRDRLEFFNAITAHFVNDKITGYQCCKQVLVNQLVGPHELTVTLNNLLCYRELMEKDDTLNLFQAVDDLFYKNNDFANHKNALEVWNLLFNQNKAKFTTLNKQVIKNIQKALSVSNTKEKIIITFTTCKRLDLFKQTLHSLLNHWLDIELITHWFCVDDNSSKEDRHFMKSTYPWLEYYMKTPDEKGHRESMNIIWAKLHTLKPTYWIHMEDDFLFHHQMDYIKPAMAVLAKNNHNIKQLVFNRNYAETIEHYNSKGHLPSDVPHIVLHDHRPHDQIKHYMNSHYWPHYSFRPAITLVKPILLLGNYDSANQFFERDYANKWNEVGYKTAFFDRITHRHIGRLTSEINSGTVKNAYELNGESQFQAIHKAHTSHVKVMNLERRADRKLDIIKLFKEVKLTDFMFFKAVDGKKLESTNELKKLFQGNDFGNRKGVIGCALSHLQLWKELVADKNYAYYIIFEDDITLTSNFKEQLEKLKPEMEKQEVLFLGYHMFAKRREEVKHIYDAIASDVKVEPLNKNLYIGGTFAYTINKIGAAKLIAHIAQHGIKHGIDYLMKITPDLNMQELQPLLVWSDWYEDKGKPIDTDIQANYDSLDFNKTLEDEFVFKPLLDQIGHDLYFQPGILTEQMSKALKDPACVGFNTLGFFKNKIETLTSSQYFREKDGIYIKKTILPVTADRNEEKKIRLKMLCNWCDSAQLCNEWTNMYDATKWKNIQMTSSSEPGEIDYYVIINSPPPNEHYIPEKTIVFQMEPWIADPLKNWGVKTWGEWATPDPTKFFKVFTHKTHLNNVQWQIDYPFSKLPIREIKQDKMAAICSQKNVDDGHLLRNKFIRYIDAMDMVDVWGRENYHQFQTYKGVVPADNKYNVYAFYKYVLAVENNSEHNYATEKIWESILCESLCFYWGCPNLAEYLDPLAFVRLPLEDPAAALQIIQQAIAEDWWSQRIGVIKQMKERILNELGFFPLLASLVQAL
jgi:GR25 family glycosyltransferase involved in LPS biosynthesis/glycosyltransferase involved in cell wall biosynthesis